jgi:2,3-bisphosphoglycerate-independent phosphoglycerate mutase
MAIILLILDGIADRPWPSLGGLTPLEAAETPNLDRFAEIAETGLLHPLGRGFAPGSELSHFVLFGYPPSLYPGRGLFESIGEYMEPEPGDVVARALFCSVTRRDDGTLLVDSRYAGVTDEQGEALGVAIGNFEHGGLAVEFAYNSKRQGLVFVRRAEPGSSTPAPSADITDGDPYVNGRHAGRILPLDSARDPEGAAATAEALDAWLQHVYRVLDPHPINDRRRERSEPPANFLLVKWASAATKLPTFRDRNGLLGASVSSGVTYCGIATALGMRWYGVEYLPDWTDDLRMRIDIARRAVDDECDFVHIHTKAPDEAGHEKDPEHKRWIIEQLDGAIGRLWETGLICDDNLVIVTGDHGTPSGTDLVHSGDPVPIALAGPGVLSDAVSSFGERPCSLGGLGHIEGRELMPIALNAAARIKYMGARLTRDNGIWWPGPDDVEPMRVDGDEV